MQAGRLNLIGAEEPDDESHFIKTTGNPATRYEFRRHNSNVNKPTTMNLAIQDQEAVLDMNDSQAILEAGMTEEQT